MMKTRTLTRFFLITVKPKDLLNS